MKNIFYSPLYFPPYAVCHSVAPLAQCTLTWWNASTSQNRQLFNPILFFILVKYLCDQIKQISTTFLFIRWAFQTLKPFFVRYICDKRKKNYPISTFSSYVHHKNNQHKSCHYWIYVCYRKFRIHPRETFAKNSTKNVSRGIFWYFLATW